MFESWSTVSDPYSNVLTVRISGQVLTLAFATEMKLTYSKVDKTHEVAWATPLHRPWTPRDMMKNALVRTAGGRAGSRYRKFNQFE